MFSFDFQEFLYSKAPEKRNFTNDALIGLEVKHQILFYEKQKKSWINNRDSRCLSREIFLEFAWKTSISFRYDFLKEACAFFSFFIETKSIKNGKFITWFRWSFWLHKVSGFVIKETFKLSSYAKWKMLSMKIMPVHSSRGKRNLRTIFIVSLKRQKINQSHEKSQRGFVRSLGHRSVEWWIGRKLPHFHRLAGITWNICWNSLSYLTKIGEELYGVLTSVRVCRTFNRIVRI